MLNIHENGEKSYEKLEGHGRNRDYYLILLILLYGEEASLHQCYANCTLVCHALVMVSQLGAFVM